MYSVILFHRVFNNNVDKFKSILKETREIYLQHGAIDCFLYSPVDLIENYGCVSFAEEIKLLEDETLLIEINCFKSHDHYGKVMKNLEEDPRRGKLHKVLKTIVNFNRTIRGEFKSIK